METSAFTPFLIKCCNVAYDYLLKHLTEEQIDRYIAFLHQGTTTHGEAYRFITHECGHPDKIFLALNSLARINALCEVAESPGGEPIQPERAFNGTFAALLAGMTLGAVVDDEGRQALIKHGKKFVSAGGHPDELSNHLMQVFREFYERQGRYPHNREVLTILENKVGQGFIHSVTVDGVEWGPRVKLIGIGTLNNRCAETRKRLGIKG